MLFFGHIGITAFLGVLLYLSPLFVGISAVLPDLIDKGLVFFSLSQYSRLYAHNLFFGPFLSGIVYLITRRKDFAIAVMFGAYMHLIEDMKEPVPWLWPLAPIDLAPVTGIKASIGLFELITESVGLSLLAALFLFNENVMLLRERISTIFKDFYDKRFVKKI